MNNPTTSIGDIFEHWLGDIKYDPKKRGLYPFMARVGVVKYRPPRHEAFEYLLNLGSGMIEDILYHKPGNIEGSLTFVFPERFMSIHEQRSFMWALCRHPQVDQVTGVDIITSSPMLVGDFYAEMIRIIEWDEDKELIPFVNGPDAAMNQATKDDAELC